VHDSFLILHVREHLCAIAAREVQEIVHLAASTKLPGQPPVLDGFLNLRGCPIPVVRLHSLFGEGYAEPDLYAPIIVIGTGSARVGLLADSVNEILDVETSALEPLGTNHSFNDCAEACFSSAGGRVTVLSPGRLLIAKERECIAALQAQLEKRCAEAEAAPG
jgi:chemotaxis signal transduction protein